MMTLLFCIFTIFTNPQQQFINRFWALAKSEEAKFGIPAKVKMAQAMLESNSGQSIPAQVGNNYFGMKCHSHKHDVQGHCQWFNSTTDKDRFLTFSTAWMNWRAHSIKLTTEDRYIWLLQIPKTDYYDWCKGIQMSGYSEDPDYAEKLLKIINEKLEYLPD